MAPNKVVHCQERFLGRNSMSLLAEAVASSLYGSSQVDSLLPEVVSTGSTYHRLPVDGHPGRDFSSPLVNLCLTLTLIKNLLQSA